MDWSSIRRVCASRARLYGTKKTEKKEVKSMFPTLFTNEIRQTLDDFRRSVDQFFGNLTGPSYQNQETPARTEWVFTPSVESAWSDTHLYLRVVLPGVTEKDVKVTAKANQIWVEGERKAPENFPLNSGYRQLMYGKFSRMIDLPAGLDLDKINCSLHDGVLDIHVPLKEETRPRRIPVLTGGSNKQITS
jgi:HSP20 family protein